MVLADGGRSLVQVVAAGITDTEMDTLDFGFRFFPVVAEFWAICILRLEIDNFSVQNA